MSRVRHASFVVRTIQDDRGKVSGVIERVATGAKEAFAGVETIGRVIAAMLQGGHDPAKRPAGGSTRKGASS